MAALIASIAGKVLIQVAGMDPVEVGTIEIPIHAGAPERIGKEIAQAFVSIGSDEHEHKPVQHRDGKPPWCNECGLTADGEEPYRPNRRNAPDAV